MRRGMTLLELVIVIVILGLLAAITLPRLGRPLATITVEQEAQRIARAHVRARMRALAANRLAVLHILPESLSIGLVEDRDTLPDWRESGPATRGVTLSGPTRSVLVAPTGIGMGVSNGTWTVEYRGVGRSVVLSRLGRVRIQR